MGRRKTLQSNFSAGEIAPEFFGRQDTEQYSSGAKSLENRRCLIGGGTKRRPGSWRRAADTGRGRLTDFVVNESTQYLLVYGRNTVKAFRPDTGAEAGSVTGCPWTAAILPEMDWTQSANTAFLVHEDMPPQVLLRTGAATWFVSDFEFFTSGPRTEQPYYKVAPADWTLQPSALTGSITLFLGGVPSAWFEADHVGTVIRYLGRECLITAVAGDGLSCTATVLENLPGTYTLTVASSAGFTVGEIVEGDTTGARGVISLIADATHVTVYLDGTLIPFATIEDLIGPNAVTTISAAPTASPAAVLDWDEQLFSPVFGYPSCVTLHRNRLLFGGHPAVPNGVIASRLNNLYSFDVGDGSDADAIFETIGDAGASRIVQLYSAEQLLIATDRGLYYCPESVTSPFRPSSMAFFQFGSPWPITRAAKARSFDGGVLFVSGSLVIKARPTGNTTQSWAADEVSLISNHLVDTPDDLAVVTNFAGGPERYAVIRNADSTLALLQLVEVQKIRNMTPWTTDGEYQSVAALGGDLYALVERNINGDLNVYLEQFDQDITLDGAVEFDDLDDVPATFPNTEVHVVTGRYALGAYPGTLEEPPAGPYTVGFFYDSTIETLPPVIDDRDGSHAGERMRIAIAHIRVLNSMRFASNGTEVQAYQVTEPLDEPPPLRSDPIRFTFLGWEVEPTITITQPDPLPLDVLYIKSTVVFGS